MSCFGRFRHEYEKKKLCERRICTLVLSHVSVNEIVAIKEFLEKYRVGQKNH
jgi:hypothetical protein